MSVAQPGASNSADVELFSDTSSEVQFRDGGDEETYDRSGRDITTSKAVVGREGVGSGEDALSTYDGQLRPMLSLFEAVVTAYPPIMESVLSQLPTASILHLFHTSRYLRQFLASYPLAWKTISFRLLQPTSIIGSPGNETPDGRERQSKTYMLDGLLIQVVVPVGTRLKSLDLCNTAVHGVHLVSRVLQPRVSTIQHLSVRGCKNVSIKYHLVPFLEPYNKECVPWARKDVLALKSLYAYRCRHHRRRPYLPSSLVRKDSDSEPTHQLIEICHELGIWTDTAWCPTPAGRCFRRKDYHNGRAAPGTPEVWVPFDRLWRSCNRIGPSQEGTKRTTSDGRLWEYAESGYDGEALGPEDGSWLGEGKDVPAHLRKSHKTFVDDIKCSQCDEDILERCEQCSVRMHCMGCRKTLCASCAFNRPVPRKRTKLRRFHQIAFGNSATAMTTTLPTLPIWAGSTDTDWEQQSPINNRFWWAPGATRSPNLMQESTSDDDSSDSEDGHTIHAIGNNAMGSPSPLKLDMHWCCLEPIFSGGGGITFLGTAIGGRGADKIRAAPLPRRKEFEDYEFSPILRSPDQIRDLKNNGLYECVLGEDMDIMPFLTQDSLNLQASTCPRSLCQDCYRTFRWKVACRGCKRPLCKEHDFRALKVRKCGFRDLQTEREYILNYKAERTELEIPAFKRTAAHLQPSEAAWSSKTILPTFSHSENHPAESSNSPYPPPHQIISSHTPGITADMAASIPSRGFLLDKYADNVLTPSLSRPRSLSVSDLRNRAPNVSWQTTPRIGPHSRVPRPGYPRHPVQWEGCGAYFCQYPRAIGDSRPRCTAGVKECKDCGVYVCDSCLNGSEMCSCGYCSTNFHCPQCELKPSVQKQCRFKEELRARAADEEAKKVKKEQEREGPRAADELAEQLGEFLFGLFNYGMDSTAAAVAVADLTNDDTQMFETSGEQATQEQGENVAVQGLIHEDQLLWQAQELQQELEAALDAVAGLDPGNIFDEDDGGVMVEFEEMDALEEASDELLEED